MRKLRPREGQGLTTARSSPPPHPHAFFHFPQGELPALWPHALGLEKVLWFGLPQTCVALLCASASTPPKSSSLALISPDFHLPLCCAFSRTGLWGLWRTRERASLMQRESHVPAGPRRRSTNPRPLPQNVTGNSSAKFEAALTWILSSNKDVGIW